MHYYYCCLRPNASLYTYILLHRMYDTKNTILREIFKKKSIKNNDSTKTKSDIFYKLHVVVVIVGRDNIYILCTHIGTMMRKFRDEVL